MSLLTYGLAFAFVFIGAAKCAATAVESRTFFHGERGLFLCNGSKENGTTMEDFENRAREVKKEIREKLNDLQGALQEMHQAFRHLGDTFDLIGKTNGFSDMS